MRPPNRIEAEFRRLIDRLLLPYLKFSPDATIAEISARLAQLSENAEVLSEIGRVIAARMTKQLNVSNERSWRQVALKGGRGREMYKALRREMQNGIGYRVQEIVSENARLISSIPERVAESVNTEIAEMQRQGLRPDTIAKHLRKRVPQLTKNRAALIARTETGKAATALTRARGEDLGIKWYQWITSEDARVRPSHRIMDKVLVAWAEPPNPEALDGIESTLGHYNAGNCPNCRCDALPLVNLDAISWPARVYGNGRIQRMTRAVFEEFAGMRRRVA